MIELKIRKIIFKKTNLTSLFQFIGFDQLVTKQRICIPVVRIKFNLKIPPINRQITTWTQKNNTPASEVKLSNEKVKCEND